MLVKPEIPIIGLSVWLLLAAPLAAQRETPQQRGVAYLAREVPRWHRENHCYSCHNNGDAARALYQARRLSYAVDDQVLSDTSDWLAAPARWKDNGGKRQYGDRDLANLQFAHALAVAVETGWIDDLAPLRRAAELVASFQSADGCWKIGAAGSIGSPATYGTTLATSIACRVLAGADDERFQERIARADAWMVAQRPRTVLDSAALLIGVAPNESRQAAEARLHCLEVIRKGQDEQGGWGPYVISQSEPFDTAIVLLALIELPPTAERTAMIAGGRRYLIASQLEEGSWQETTRPARGQSYPLRISTSGWATLALLMTRE